MKNSVDVDPLLKRELFQRRLAAEKRKQIIEAKRAKLLADVAKGKLFVRVDDTIENLKHKFVLMGGIGATFEKDQEGLFAGTVKMNVNGGQFQDAMDLLKCDYVKKHHVWQLRENYDFLSDVDEASSPNKVAQPTEEKKQH